MQEETKDSLRTRLRRVEGQVRGIARMIDEDRYCVDVINQVQAVRAALRSLEDEIIRDHANHCVADAIRAGDPKEQDRKIEELLMVLGRIDR